MTHAALSTVAPGTALCAKNRGQVLRVVEEIRVEAGEEMKRAFPGALKRYALPYLPESTLSKARMAYVCCPLFRAALCIVALRVGGAPRERAQRLVDSLQALVDRLWPKEEAEASADELVRKETRIDGAEDREQTDMLLGVVGARERWLECLRERRALDATLLRAFGPEGA